MKFSKQRESIKNYLLHTTAHPTAETVYNDIKEEFPNISLGTVYRNLSLLSDIGEIQKLSTGDGADRFDGNANPHYHFVCHECHEVSDLEMESLNHIDLLAAHNFNGRIEGHIAYFYGLCPACAAKEAQLEKNGEKSKKEVDSHKTAC